MKSLPTEQSNSCKTAFPEDFSWTLIKKNVLQGTYLYLWTLNEIFTHAFLGMFNCFVVQA